MLEFSNYRIPVYLTKEETESISAQIKDILRQYKTSLEGLDQAPLKESIQESLDYFQQLQLIFHDALEQHRKFSAKRPA
jgi:ABC-type transporter Mla subunit MlaD